MPVFPLDVSGRYIVDATGARAKLLGANWMGNLDPMVPGGLDILDRKSIARQITELGLNSVRMTFALQMFYTNTPVPNSFLSANPDLFGMTPWQVYQACVKTLTDAGIMVIPNCHILHSGWCCSQADNNGLWYNSNWPESRFYNSWQTIATTFASNPLVIGYDLKNEPRATPTLTPSWGDGNPATDFKIAYEKAAGLIHAIDPDPLIICEGLNYASDLTHAVTAPIQADKVVYSAHDYSWFHTSGQSYANYKTQMDNNGGGFLRDGTAPVWFSEFGVNQDNPLGGGWVANFLQYAGEYDADVCAWVLDGTNHQGTEPTTNTVKVTEGSRQGFGLLSANWIGSANIDFITRINSL